MVCKWVEICPLRRFEREGKLEDNWKEKYCNDKSNWKNCKRYQFEEENVFHEDNLLPDGRILKI